MPISMKKYLSRIIFVLFGLFLPLCASANQTALLDLAYLWYFFFFQLGITCGWAIVKGLADD